MENKNRRKSSVFRMQLLTVEEKDQNDVLPKLDIKEDDIISDHVLEMEKEKTDWISCYRRTKSKYQELDKYKDDVNVISRSDCENDLSQEDKDFLAARPDYAATIRKLDEMAAKIHILQVSNYHMKLKSKNNVTKVSHSVHQVKQNLCDYLLAYDESSSLIAANP